MSNERNPVGWFEIYVSDMPRARAFYEAMLNTRLEYLPAPVPGVELWAFPMEMDRPGAAGSLVKMDGCGAGGGGTLVYFSCDDCGEEEARAAKAGGQVVKAKFPIGQYGFISMVADTEGNTIGLHSIK